MTLSKSHLPCLVLVEPRKRWTDDRLGQTVTRLEITLCLMCLVQGTDNMDETVPHTDNRGLLYKSERAIFSAIVYL